MKQQNIMLLSMDEAKTKKIANIVGNDSCKKILDFLSENDATESELAEKLNIPISTIHYNIRQLLESGLVISEEFHYSEKGKEVSHYRLASKYIIITPKKTFGIKQRLMSVLPAALIIIGIASVMQIYSIYSQPKAFADTMLKSAMMETAKESVSSTVSSAVSSASQSIAQSALPTIVSQPNIALLFLVGGLVGLLAYVLVGIIKKDK